MSNLSRFNLSARIAFAAVIILAGFASAATAEQKTKTKKLTASRAQVEAACGNSAGGFAYGTQASGGNYGCISNGGWIDCNSNGKCEGGRNPQGSGGRPQ